MSKSESNSETAAATDQDDGPDDWYGMAILAKLGPNTKLCIFCRDKRIFSTGCAGESIQPDVCVLGKLSD
jgi:hypothetical protein